MTFIDENRNTWRVLTPNLSLGWVLDWSSSMTGNSTKPFLIPHSDIYFKKNGLLNPFLSSLKLILDGSQRHYFDDISICVVTSVTRYQFIYKKKK